MKKPTLKDIAAAAGVASATVERVLNGRGGVRPETVEKVICAAKSLGYDRRLPDMHRGTIRIEVMLVRPETSFYSRMNRAFERIAASLDSSIFVHRTLAPEHDPEALERQILAPGFKRSALIIAAPDHPSVCAALRKVSEAGVPVIQVVSHAEPSLPYVGIDNLAAGRTAGFYMSSMLSGHQGRVLALCHSDAYAVHRQRVAGFSDGLKAHGGPELAHVVMAHDDELMIARRLSAALAEDPSIIGLYTAGGGNAAVAVVLQQARRNILWIGHELTENSRSFLRAGVMRLLFDQAPETQARRALDTVLSHLGLISVEVSSEPVRFYTITAENL